MRDGGRAGRLARVVGAASLAVGFVRASAPTAAAARALSPSLPPPLTPWMRRRRVATQCAQRAPAFVNQTHRLYHPLLFSLQASSRAAFLGAGLPAAAPRSTPRRGMVQVSEDGEDGRESVERRPLAAFVSSVARAPDFSARAGRCDGDVPPSPFCRPLLPARDAHSATWNALERAGGRESGAKREREARRRGQADGRRPPPPPTHAQPSLPPFFT